VDFSDLVPRFFVVQDLMNRNGLCICEIWKLKELSIVIIQLTIGDFIDEWKEIETMNKS
jgi:hypothetical protein